MRRFAYRLAAHHRQPNVDAMLRSISWVQFREWMAYAELEPFDERRMDYRFAQIATLLYNINRGKNRAAKAIADFLLEFGDTKQAKPKQTPKQQEEIGRQFFLMFQSQQKAEEKRQRAAERLKAQREERERLRAEKAQRARQKTNQARQKPKPGSGPRLVNR